MSQSLYTHFFKIGKLHPKLFLPLKTVRRFDFLKKCVYSYCRYEVLSFHADKFEALEAESRFVYQITSGGKTHEQHQDK